MISAWTKNCTSQDEKEAFQRTVLGSKSVLERLQQLLDEMKEDANSLELNPKMYDTPNWDYRQADLNGYKRCLRQVSTIINLDQQETK